MGDLPTKRVQPARPFAHSGVDYAGPFLLKTSRHRGYKSYKGYFAIFVCLCTKAVHLEVVTGYDTAAFIAAFKWFVSRRGPCLRLLSDQGTNFVGAYAELRSIHVVGSSFRFVVSQDLEWSGTVWSFNPPGAPHFGGIWEAAVRSSKYHLKRIIGESILTYEEFATLLCQIEACLNSRPLVPLTEDPSDSLVLTPVHFLIGETSSFCRRQTHKRSHSSFAAMETSTTVRSEVLGLLVLRLPPTIADSVEMEGGSSISPGWRRSACSTWSHCSHAMAAGSRCANLSRLRWVDARCLRAHRHYDLKTPRQQAG